MAAGELHHCVVRADRVRNRSNQEIIRRSIVATWKNDLPKRKTVIIADATADADEIQELIGNRPLRVTTPPGELQRRHPVAQIAIDITKATTAKRVLSVLRGILAAFPRHNRIGIICHQKHRPAIAGTARSGPTLDELSRRRIAKVEHFHGGEDRASNEWLHCDLLLVLGTPRVPPATVRTHLIRLGRIDAANRDGSWQRDYWSGITLSGHRKTVRSLAYCDWEWYQAHRSIVAAELIQAIGRGRGVSERGLPVLVASTEPLDVPLLDLDEDDVPLDGSDVRILDAIDHLTTPETTQTS